MTIHDMQVKLEALAEDVRITEERREALDLERRRYVVEHSLLLHRGGVSADDVRAMIAHLEAAGMPGAATLKIDTFEKRSRAYATWSTELIDEAPPPEEQEPGPELAPGIAIGDTVIRNTDPKRIKTRGVVIAERRDDARGRRELEVRWPRSGTPIAWPWLWEEALTLAPDIDEAPHDRGKRLGKAVAVDESDEGVAVQWRPEADEPPTEDEG